MKAILVYAGGTSRGTQTTGGSRLNLNWTLSKVFSKPHFNLCLHTSFEIQPLVLFVQIKHDPPVLGSTCFETRIIQSSENVSNFSRKRRIVRFTQQFEGNGGKEKQLGILCSPVLCSTQQPNKTGELLNLEEVKMLWLPYVTVK